MQLSLQEKILLFTPLIISIMVFFIFNSSNFIEPDSLTYLEYGRRPPFYPFLLDIFYIKENIKIIQIFQYSLFILSSFFLILNLQKILRYKILIFLFSICIGINFYSNSYHLKLLPESIFLTLVNLYIIFLIKILSKEFSFLNVLIFLIINIFMIITKEVGVFFNIFSMSIILKNYIDFKNKYNFLYLITFPIVFLVTVNSFKLDNNIDVMILGKLSILMESESFLVPNNKNAKDLFSTLQEEFVDNLDKSDIEYLKQRNVFTGNIDELKFTNNIFVNSKIMAKREVIYQNILLKNEFDLPKIYLNSILSNPKIYISNLFQNLLGMWSIKPEVLLKIRQELSLKNVLYFFIFASFLLTNIIFFILSFFYFFFLLNFIKLTDSKLRFLFSSSIIIFFYSFFVSIANVNTTRYLLPIIPFILLGNLCICEILIKNMMFNQKKDVCK